MIDIFNHQHRETATTSTLCCYYDQHPNQSTIHPSVYYPSTKLIHTINTVLVLTIHSLIHSYIHCYWLFFFLWFFIFCWFLFACFFFAKSQKLKSKNNPIVNCRKTCPSPRKHIRSTATVLTNCRWQLCWFIYSLDGFKTRTMKK